MALFQFICPRCGKPALLDSLGACTTVFPSGARCDFSLPIQYDDGNSKFKSKMEKHTNSPPSGEIGPYSWVDSSGTYHFCQQNVMDSESLHLDTKNNYLFLWTTPSGNGPLANILYGSAGTVGTASGVIMPLNSKPQNLHHFYDNYQPYFKHIADGPGLSVTSPDSTHPDYHIALSGNIIFRYDPVTRTEYWT